MRVFEYTEGITHALLCILCKPSCLLLQQAAAGCVTAAAAAIAGPTDMDTDEAAAAPATGTVESLLHRLLAPGAQQQQQQGVLPTASSTAKCSNSATPEPPEHSSSSTAAGSGLAVAGPAQLTGTSRCCQIVEAIRRKEFGIGLELDEQNSDLRQRQNDRMGRALQRLSQVMTYLRLVLPGWPPPV